MCLIGPLGRCPATPPVPSAGVTAAVVVAPVVVELLVVAKAVVVAAEVGLLVVAAAEVDALVVAALVVDKAEAVVAADVVIGADVTELSPHAVNIPTKAISVTAKSAI